MICISIDPGDTTGIVIIETQKHQILESHSANPTTETLPTITLLFNQQPIQRVLIERAPRKPSRPAPYVLFHEIMEFLTTYGYDELCTVYSPGDWKPVAKARKWGKPVKGMSQHESDAANIYRYHVWVNGKIDIQLIG